MVLDAAFRTMPFPADGSIVYVIGVQRREEFIPIYVGESDRHLGRIGDYVSAKFSAQTDFKVGTAAKYLMKRGENVIVKYKNSADRTKEQDELICEFKVKGFGLLNDLPGYDYRAANEEQERDKIRSFLEGIRR